MTTREHSDTRWWVARDLTVAPSASEPGNWLISWGEGSARETLSAARGSVASALVTLPSPVTAEEIIRQLTDADLPPDAARQLREYLIANGALLAQPDEPTPAERRWDALNLHDALVFHRATRNVMWRHEYPANAQVMTWDNYDKPIVPEAPRPPVMHPDGPDAFPLPEPAADSLHSDGFEALANRRTRRSFRGTTITVQQVADLLHWSLRPIIQGDGRRYFSTLSCADGYRETIEPHPITAHLFFNHRKLPEELTERGHLLYRYNPVQHSIVPERINPGEYYLFSRLLWDQDFADEAPLMVILGVNWSQFMWKYRVSHAYRLAHFDLGAYMQTVLVTAAALGLRTFMTPAVDDSRVARLLGTDESEYAPSYTLAVGAAPQQPTDQEPEQVPDLA